MIRIRQKKILNCFSGTAASVLKAPHYFFFYCFLKKKKKKKTLFRFLNIIIGNDHVVSLGRCGPLPVMLASLFNLDSISGISSMLFYCVLLVFEPQQCKFYA